MTNAIIRLTRGELSAAAVACGMLADFLRREAKKGRLGRAEIELLRDLTKASGKVIDGLADWENDPPPWVG